MRASLYLVLIVLAFGSTGVVARQSANVSSGTITYREFMSLAPDGRERAWSELSAQTRASLKPAIVPHGSACAAPADGLGCPLGLVGLVQRVCGQVIGDRRSPP